MSVAKKDQERQTYAWMYGAQARREDKERVVPQVWENSPMPGCKVLTAAMSLRVQANPNL